MKVLLNEKDVVVAKGSDIVLTPTGFLIAEQNTYYAPHGLRIEQTNLNPRVQQDKLVNGKVELNPDYKSPEEIQAELEKSRLIG